MDELSDEQLETLVQSYAAKVLKFMRNGRINTERYSLEDATNKINKRSRAPTDLEQAIQNADLPYQDTDDGVRVGGFDLANYHFYNAFMQNPTKRNASMLLGLWTKDLEEIGIDFTQNPSDVIPIYQFVVEETRQLIFDDDYDSGIFDAIKIAGEGIECKWYFVLDEAKTQLAEDYDFGAEDYESMCEQEVRKEAKDVTRITEGYRSETYDYIVLGNVIVEMKLSRNGLPEEINPELVNQLSSPGDDELSVDHYGHSLDDLEHPDDRENSGDIVLLPN